MSGCIQAHSMQGSIYLLETSRNASLEGGTFLLQTKTQMDYQRRRIKASSISTKSSRL